MSNEQCALNTHACTQKPDALCSINHLCQFVQPAHCDLGERLIAHIAASAAKVDHLIHSMEKLQARRDKSHKQAVQLGTHIAHLEANLASAKLQATEAQGDVQSADKAFAVLSQQLGAWEQELQGVLTTLHVAKRRRLR